ncbi:AbrB/MazE/SpoVT family DNA-binding domain-containing protein [Neorhizobium sp. LjRoot104]
MRLERVAKICSQSSTGCFLLFQFSLSELYTKIDRSARLTYRVAPDFFAFDFVRNDAILHIVYRSAEGKIMATATLSSKFQISIPKEIREKHNWQAGQQFAFIPQGKGVILVPVPTREELYGMAEGADTSNYRDRNDRY